MAALVFNVRAEGIFTLDVEEEDTYSEEFLKATMLDLLRNGFAPGYTTVELDLIEVRGKL